MPTALSSTEAATGRSVTRVAEVHRAIRDVGHLFRFRAQATRRRHVAVAVLAGLVVVTLAAAVGPMFLPGAATGDGRSLDVLLVIPSAMAGVLLLNIAGGIASGGGRELVPREQAVAYPVSPTTDHLGALLLAPLNIAWLVQAWIVLAATAYAVQSDRLVTAQLVMVLWLLVATCVGQAIAWAAEAVRRGPAGILITRVLLVLLAVAAGVVQVTGHTGDLLNLVPTVWVFTGGASGWTSRWVTTVLLLLVISVAAIVVGAWPAHLAARRLPRDEARLETGRYEPRQLPRTELGLLMRVDRAAVWRSVPMRRGVLVLAIGPGLVALFGNLQWYSMTILPGLVASGGALLFGVNAWSLDGRGALWRESLPVQPGDVFFARAWVLAEFLAVASLVTIAIGGLRAGVPSAAELTALTCTVLVVLLQVVGASMRWSQARPYQVDLRSARATPAPPGTMVGYSARLATSTTFTGLMFSAAAHAPVWGVSVFVAIPCLAWSGIRLLRTARRWHDPAVRARVVTTTAA